MGNVPLLRRENQDETGFSFIFPLQDQVMKARGGSCREMSLSSLRPATDRGGGALAAAASPPVLTDILFSEVCWQHWRNNTVQCGVISLYQKRESCCWVKPLVCVAQYCQHWLADRVCHERLSRFYLEVLGLHLALSACEAGLLHILFGLNLCSTILPPPHFPSLFESHPWLERSSCQKRDGPLRPMLSGTEKLLTLRGLGRCLLTLIINLSLFL